MSEYLNHACAICGEKYHGCDACDETVTYMPWRSIVDTIEHYKIYMIIRDYVNEYIDKEKANKLLSERDLSGKDNFISEIKIKIDEIMKQENNYSTILKPNRNKKK